MKLSVQKRNTFWKKVKRLRKEWLIPGIVYGKHLERNIPIQFKKIEFLKIYRQAWESTPITLEGEDFQELVLIHDLDVHSVTDELLHVDFLAVKADEKVEAEVPIVLVGESPVEKNNIGRVELVKDAVLVEAYPQDLPHEIKVDISKIQTPADVIHVSDLEVPEKVTIKENLEETVATVVEFESEWEEEGSSENVESSSTTE